METYQHKSVSAMSLGMKQHVLLGMYIISDADLLLFDEPLNGLDPTSIEMFTRIFSQLRDKGKTIIMSSHQLGNVTEVANRVIFLKAGHIEIFNTDTIDLKSKYNQLFPVIENYYESCH